MNMTRIIRNTVYQVKVYNDRQDDISMEDAILRLILNLLLCLRILKMLRSRRKKV